MLPVQVHSGSETAPTTVTETGRLLDYVRTLLDYAARRSLTSTKDAFAFLPRTVSTALVSIAHPDFREELDRKAHELRLTWRDRFG